MNGKHLTTGQVARMCGVAPRTVSKWCDSGRLPCFRLPGSGDRRISREALCRMLEGSGMPLPAELTETGEEVSYGVLVVGADAALVARLVELLPAAEDFRVRVAWNWFDAGIAVASRPDVLIIDLAIGRSEAITVVERLRDDQAHSLMHRLAVACEDETAPGSLAAAGFAEVFRRPFDAALLAERVRALSRS